MLLGRSREATVCLIELQIDSRFIMYTIPFYGECETIARGKIWVYETVGEGIKGAMENANSISGKIQLLTYEK